MPITEVLQSKLNEAIVFFSKNQFDEAIDILIKLIKDYPGYAPSYNLSGACYVALGELEKGIHFYKKAISIDPNYSKAHYNLGCVYQDLSRINDAIECYKSSIKIDSNFAEAHNNLGTSFVDLGKTEDAIECFKKALEINPDYLEARYSIALQFQIKGNRNSIEHFKKIIELKPDFADVYNRLGIIYYEFDESENSIKAFKRAIEINSNSSDAYNNLGSVLKNLGQYDEALEYSLKAIELNPTFVAAHNNLGNIYSELQQFDNAIKSFGRAIKLNPSYSEAYFNLGLVYEEYGNSSDAVISYKKALDINPDLVDALNNLGNVYIELGLKNEAISCYEKALQIKPNFANIHRNLSTIKKFQEGDAQIDKIKSLLANNNLNASDRINLCFALANAYRDLNEKEELFKFLNEGNYLRKLDLNYSFVNDRDKHLFYLESVKEALRELNYLDQHSSKIKPIFIVGMPRSGTSLLEQIISSHSQVHGAGELDFLIKAISPIVDECISKDIRISGSDLNLIRKKYYHSLASLNSKEKIISDKMPTNFEYIGYILLSMPDAKIINLKRDPMATSWSIYSHYFPSGGFDFAYSMEDIADFYNSYTMLMNQWHKLFPGKIYDIQYENLTINQEYETRKVLEYCDLDWEENCLNFQDNKRSVKTASVLQVKKGIYQGSSEVWKGYKSFLSPLINRLNYYKEI